MAADPSELLKGPEKSGASETGVTISPIFTSARYKQALTISRLVGVQNPSFKDPHLDSLGRLIDGPYTLDSGNGYLEPRHEIQCEGESVIINDQVVTSISVVRENPTGLMFKKVNRHGTIPTADSVGRALFEVAPETYIGIEAEVRAQELVAAYLSGQ